MELKMVLDLGFGNSVYLEGTAKEIARKVEGAVKAALPHPVQVITTPERIERSLERHGYATIKWRDLEYDGYGKEYEYGNLNPVEAMEE